MRKVILHIAFLILLGVSHSAKTQDVHFSQFHASTFWVNPALTGSFNGDLRVTSQYRNQWSFAAAFNTLAVTLDAPIIRFKNDDYFAAGLQIMADRAGDLNFSTTEFALSLAFHKTLSQYVNHYISTGFQAGYHYRYADFTRIVGDPEPGLLLGNNQLWFHNYSAGLNWYLAPRRNVWYYAGFSLNHVNEPVQSFVSDQEVVLPRRTTLYAGTSIILSDELFLQPAMLYSSQGGFQEFNTGLSLKFWLNRLQSNFEQEKSLYLGLWYRWNDAVIPGVRFDYREFNFGFSYDVNVSRLRNASNLNGGPEISIIYILNNGESRMRSGSRSMLCPNFL